MADIEGNSYSCSYIIKSLFNTTMHYYLNGPLLNICWLRTCCRSYHHWKLQSILPISSKWHGQELAGFKFKFQPFSHILKTKHNSLLLTARNILCCNRVNNIQRWKLNKPTVTHFCYYSNTVQTVKTSDYRDVFDRYCDSLIEEYERIMSEAADSKLNLDDLHRRQYLAPRIDYLNEWKAKKKEYEEMMEMKKEYENSSEDAKDLISLLKADIEICENDLEDLKSQVHAAVGGSESMLFTSEILVMYLNYIQYKGWSYDRIPKTEKGSRMHTSTMTVSVLPQPKEEERSQIQNKAIAMIKLRTKLYQMQIENQAKKTQSQRKLQVGTANRSEKIRTYNYNQDRVTDHRIHYTKTGIRDLMSGGETLDELINTLNNESKKEIFEEMLHDFEMNEKKKDKLLKKKVS
ncbi:hypothetical protein KUTeg_022847 [Tegillarca granosa]|uniref:Peptide chain release factor domain-containing protein n=1 Tax=Tegillarca granosa TaxID=220873 RepID=A0ABQ9E4I9_TEGGR|nr:hypothetical protein KUTeg_022847 [Tegillarca granosa]